MGGKNVLTQEKEHAKAREHLSSSQTSKQDCVGRGEQRGAEEMRSSRWQMAKGGPSMHFGFSSE